jgi:hypothetical protein
LNIFGGAAAFSRTGTWSLVPSTVVVTAPSAIDVARGIVFFARRNPDDNSSDSSDEDSSNSVNKKKLHKPKGSNGWDWIAEKFGMDRDDLGDLIHEIKDDFNIPGNGDLLVDLKTGNLYFDTGEGLMWVGKLG